MVANIGDVAITLFVDDRLIGAAPLKVVVTDEPHVPGFGRVAFFGACADAPAPISVIHPSVKPIARKSRISVAGLIPAPLQ